jgi:hypothetical protein
MKTLVSHQRFSRALTRMLRARRWAPSVVCAVVLAMLACSAPAALAAEEAGFGSPEFGVARTAISARNQDGSPSTQAGAHPFGLTTTFVLNQTPYTGGTMKAYGDLKDLKLELPPGFVGNPHAMPDCTYQEFVLSATYGEKPCPNASVVGVSTTWIAIAGRPTDYYAATSDPVYNLVPPTGVAAEFGYLVAGSTPVFLQSSLRVGTDYGLTVNVPNTSEAVVIAASKVTIWGVPADPAHNDIRGSCVGGILGSMVLEGEPISDTPGDGLNEGEDEVEGPVGPPSDEEVPIVSHGECPVQAPETPLLTNPTSCGVPRTASLSVASWQEPGIFKSTTASLPELTGCEKLDFSPTVSMVPDGTAGSTPTGLTVGIHIPQETTENPVGDGEADVRNTTVTLPAGVQLSPGAADGLQACSIEQMGFTGFKELEPSVEPGVATAQFTPAVPSCPNASKIANVRIATPLLEHELTGSVYLAAPQNYAGALANPFSALVAMYLFAEEPIAGVRIKLAGKVSLNPQTGQVTTTFENTPEAPVNSLKFEFFGTARAPLTTPSLCGTYTTEAALAPWSGTPPVVPSSSFQVTSGPQVETAIGPQLMQCSDPLPFGPSLISGTINVNAGGFSELTTTFSREDGQQPLSAIELHYPTGVSGLLAGAEGHPAVALCGEAQANEGTCGPDSQVGETVVSVGLGDDPFSVTGGKVYLTGPYRGAPFGLSIVTPAKAGPFELQEGRPVVVRAKVDVDPHTAALSVTTDPPGSPHAIPTMIDGIPLQIKHVNVLINRPYFTFNPTNCEKMQITGTVYSTEGASSPVSVPFQVANCAVLRFQPNFTATVTGKNSRKNGVGFSVKLEYPKAPLDTQANVKLVKVELPVALPSRLSTLQKACLAAQFAANPAGCPVDSIVGHAKAVTPLVPVPLEGSAYFVSNGAEAFPNLVLVLQGYGVTIDLVGDTYINKAGITSSTFRTIPDAPVGSFELTFFQGPDSVLTSNKNLCDTNLVMPTQFVAQNGATVDQGTHIEVEGCSNALVIVSKKIKGKTITLKVAVPAAGELTATGKGLSKGSKPSSARETITVVLHQKKGGKLKTKIKLHFKPSKGNGESMSLAIALKK